MKRILGLVVAFLLSAGYAQAQGCPTCFVAGNTDTPAIDGAPYPGYIAGWGFECGSGEGVDQIDLYYSDDTAPNRRATPSKRAKAFTDASMLSWPTVTGPR